MPLQEAGRYKWGVDGVLDLDRKKLDGEVCDLGCRQSGGQMSDRDEKLPTLLRGVVASLGCWVMLGSGEYIQKGRLMKALRNKN